MALLWVSIHSATVIFWNTEKMKTKGLEEEESYKLSLEAVFDSVIA